MTGNIFSTIGLPAIAAVSLAAAQKLVGSADYVIVGGGLVGFVLIEQLSPSPDTHVVLLEAGPNGINSSLVNSNSPIHKKTSKILLKETQPLLIIRRSNSTFITSAYGQIPTWEAMHPV